MNWLTNFCALHLWGLCLTFPSAMAWAVQPVGWVEAPRVKMAGSAHETLPPDASMLCQAAETTLNAGQKLNTPPETLLGTDDALTRVHLGPYANASSPEVTHIVVNGRRMAAVAVDEGGTSHDTIVYVFSDDLKSLLSPADRDDDIENNGDHLWDFGLSEDVVTVLGRPMVRSRYRPYGARPIYLSIINREGHTVPTCEINKEPLEKRTIGWSANNGVCRAILAGKQIPVPMHPPTTGESLVMRNVPAQYSFGGLADSTAFELNYHDNGQAADVMYTLQTTGIADLDNSGKSQKVGLVGFWEGNSSAGDGTFSESQIFPVYLNKSGVADLSSEANRKLAAALPQDGTSGGKLVMLDGTTYLELSPNRHGPNSLVFKIDSTGVHQVCWFKLTHEVARTISQ